MAQSRLMKRRNRERDQVDAPIDTSLLFSNERNKSSFSTLLGIRNRIVLHESGYKSPSMLKVVTVNAYLNECKKSVP